MGKTYTARGTGPIPAAPVNSALPVVTGTATLGQTLTCSVGGWTEWPVGVKSYQWIRGASTTIAGATNPTYIIQAADQTNTVKCRVTSANDWGTTQATSAPTGTIP